MHEEARACGFQRAAGRAPCQLQRDWTPTLCPFPVSLHPLYSLLMYRLSRSTQPRGSLYVQGLSLAPEVFGS